MAEQLALVASVEDKFTAPLRALRDRIRDVHGGSGDSLKRLHEGFSGVASGAERAAGAVRNTLTPALTALGVTTLTVSGALAAVAATVKSFSTSTADLSTFSREVGVTADRMRVFEALGQRFGLSADQMRNATRSFASNMYDFRRGVGETWAWLRTMEPDKDGKPGFASSLRNMTNEDALGHIIAFIDRIKDPIARARAAGKLLGDESLGILGSGVNGPLRKQVEEIQRTIGRLPESAEKAALQARLAFSRLRESMQGLRDRVGADLAPALTQASEGLARWVQANGPAISKSIREATTWFTNQNWEEISVKAIKIATEFKNAAVAIANAASAIAKLFGGAEPKIASPEMIQRYVIPREEADRQRLQKLRADRDALAREGEGDEPGSSQASVRRGRIYALDEQIKRLQEAVDKAVKDGMDRGSKEGSKKVEENTKSMWERMRSWFRASAYDDGAANGGAGGFGNLIQRASLGGEAARGLAFGSPGARGGGLFASGGGGRAPGGGSPTGAGGPASGPHGARIAAAKAAIMDQLRKEGVPESNLAEATNLLTGQALAESGLNPNQVHDSGTGFGIYGARLDRRDRMLAWLKQNGFDPNSLEGQSKYMAHEAMSGGYRRTRDALMNADPSRRGEQTHAITREFENPKVVNNRTGDVARAAGVTARRQQDQAQAGEPGAPLVEGGRYTSGFGMRRHPLRGGHSLHAGVDLAAKAGSAARARQGGTVTGVSRHGDVTVRYEDGTTGTYRHINANVEQGQKIAAGETLGTLKQNDPGRSTGPHLHYESRDADGNLVNPRALMDAGVVGSAALRNKMAGFGDAMKSLNERGQAFAMPTMPMAQANPGLQDAARNAAGVTTVQGSANLNIKLDGFPSGMRTSTSVDGLFKDVQVDRGRQMVTGAS